MKAPSNDINDYPDADLLFPGNYIKSAEVALAGRPIPITITSIDPRHELKRQGSKKPEYKPAIFFKETDKGFVCNKTNAKRIVEVLGKDPRAWIGKRVVFCIENVESFGKMVDAIRVDIKETRAANAGQKRGGNGGALPSNPDPDEAALAAAAAEAERAAAPAGTWDDLPR